MRKLFIASACVALAACGSNDAEVAEADLDVGDGIAEPAAQSTVPTADLAGSYEMTADDGTVTMQQLNADGSYVDTVDGEETDRGTYRAQGEQLCYTSQTRDGGETCYVGSRPDTNGEFELRDNRGTTIQTVRRLDTGGI